MRTKFQSLGLSALIALLATFGHERPAEAAEGAGSLYLPGGAGDILLAKSPLPGWQIASAGYYQTGDASAAVLQGRASVALDLDIFLVTPAISYTFKEPVLGGTYSVDAVMPFGSADLTGRLTGPRGNTFQAQEDVFDVADAAVTPVDLSWTSGNFNFKFSETIVIPIGGYDVNETVNLGRNYWAFDTVGAVTWFDPEKGTEVSLAPGVLFNTENDATNYKTGTEFHLDFTVSQFMSPTFAIGVRGYYYKQLSGDSGSGAILGDFKGEAFGIGPGFLWVPKVFDGKLNVVGKWMRDVHTENRFDSDYVTLGAAWKF